MKKFEVTSILHNHRVWNYKDYTYCSIRMRVRASTWVGVLRVRARALVCLCTRARIYEDLYACVYVRSSGFC